MNIVINGQHDYWTVVAQVSAAQYRCRCRCGAVRTLYASTLRWRKSLSCGCLRAARTPNVADVVGEWTVLARQPGARTARCRCSCGAERNVEVYTLGRDSLSCGHARSVSSANVPAQVRASAKRCAGCDQVKEFSAFHRDATSVDGRRTRCRQCVAEYHQRNAAARNAAARTRYAADPETKKRATAAYRRDHPEYGLTRGRLARGGGRWVGDVTAAGLAKILAEHENRCYICEIVFDAGNPLTWDHYQPIARGGDHALNNLRPACGPCNKAKNARWPFTEALRDELRTVRRALALPA